MIRKKSCTWCLKSFKNPFSKKLRKNVLNYIHNFFLKQSDKKETGKSSFLIISSTSLHNNGLCRSKCVTRNVWLIQIHSQIGNVTTDQKYRIFVNILFDSSSRSQERGPKLSQTELPPLFRYTFDSQSINHIYADNLCTCLPLHFWAFVQSLASRNTEIGLLLRSPNDNWNSSLFQSNNASQLETHHCQNLP